MFMLGDVTTRIIDGEQYVLIGTGDGEYKKIKLSDIQKRNNKSKESKWVLIVVSVRMMESV